MIIEIASVGSSLAAKEFLFYNLMPTVTKKKNDKKGK
jgi:hypothetical protein